MHIQSNKIGLHKNMICLHKIKNKSDLLCVIIVATVENSDFLKTNFLCVLQLVHKNKIWASKAAFYEIKKKEDL